MAESGNEMEILESVGIIGDDARRCLVEYHSRLQELGKTTWDFRGWGSNALYALFGSDAGRAAIALSRAT